MARSTELTLLASTVVPCNSVGLGTSSGCIPPPDTGEPRCRPVAGHRGRLGGRHSTPEGRPPGRIRSPDTTRSSTERQGSVMGTGRSSRLTKPAGSSEPTARVRGRLAVLVEVIGLLLAFLLFSGRDVGNGQNHYSAMPSLHVGWSAWCAYAVWSALRASHPRLALLAWAFPLGMEADVLITGNHYVLDIAGSTVLLLGSIAVASLCGRLAERWTGSGGVRVMPTSAAPEASQQEAGSSS